MSVYITDLWTYNDMSRYIYLINEHIDWYVYVLSTHLEKCIGAEFLLETDMSVYIPDLWIYLESRYDWRIYYPDEDNY